MTITIDPITVTTLIAVLLAAAGAFIWFGKTSKRVDNLETNVNELKTDVRELRQGVQDVLILILLHSHMGYHQTLGRSASDAIPDERPLPQR